MANDVTQDQCEGRRLHCSESLTKFLIDLRKDLKPINELVVRHDEKIGELTKKHGRLMNLFIGLLLLFLAEISVLIVRVAVKGF